MSDTPEQSVTAASQLDQHLRKYPHLAERIHRELLVVLHRRGIVSIDSIHDEARRRTGQLVDDAIQDPNQTEADRWDETERAIVDEISRDHASKHFSAADINDIVNLTIKREKVQSLENVVNRQFVTFAELAEHTHKFCDLPLGETILHPAEVMGTRVALARHLISDQLELLAVAKNHLHIRDFDDILRRTIGSDAGMGRIGGKAGGMLLAHGILTSTEKEEEPFLPIAVPESYYLRSDVVEDFLHLNRLDEYQTQKYKPIEDLTREYPLIRGVFRNGDFPLKITHQLRQVLEKVGKNPLIVRSSSLLEDRFGTAFCGKYASFFLANQGPLEHRLRALLGAIAEVYASVLAPDPIVYRQEHKLIDYVEEMAVLIQKVVGQRIGDYFLPAFAGVAFSQNEYRWSPRIKREDGLARLVMGLGTRAVDRTGGDYPRMIALGAPTIRPESSAREIRRCAQRTMDVINLAKNRFETIRLTDLLAQGAEFPMLDKITSIFRDNELYRPTGSQVDADPASLCITFDKLLHDTPFAARLSDILTRLENAYGMPVDAEFACDGERFYILQCRTQCQHTDSAPVSIPENIPNNNVIFDANKFVRTGLIENVEYLVFVDPTAYSEIPSRQERVAAARAVGRINHKLKDKSFILVGPGRWGSNDVRLGVPVRYADINHCKLLVEVARETGGFVPEVSFGTHFFQDLVEAGIHYLPLYPDDNTNRYDERFFSETPNALSQISPDDAEFDRIVRVFDIAAQFKGRTITVVMDGDTDKAVTYLTS